MSDFHTSSSCADQAELHDDPVLETGFFEEAMLDYDSIATIEEVENSINTSSLLATCHEMIPYTNEGHPIEPDPQIPLAANSFEFSCLNNGSVDTLPSTEIQGSGGISNLDMPNDRLAEIDLQMQILNNERQQIFARQNRLNSTHVPYNVFSNNASEMRNLQEDITAMENPQADLSNPATYETHLQLPSGLMAFASSVPPGTPLYTKPIENLSVSRNHNTDFALDPVVWFPGPNDATITGLPHAAIQQVVPQSSFSEQRNYSEFLNPDPTFLTPETHSYVGLNLDAIHPVQHHVNSGPSAGYYNDSSLNASNQDSLTLQPLYTSSDLLTHPKTAGGRSMNAGDVVLGPNLPPNSCYPTNNKQRLNIRNRNQPRGITKKRHERPRTRSRKEKVAPYERCLSPFELGLPSQPASRRQYTESEKLNRVAVREKGGTCLYCHLTKLKCSGGSPCGNCRRIWETKVNKSTSFQWTCDVRFKFGEIQFSGELTCPLNNATSVFSMLKEQVDHFPTIKGWHSDFPDPFSMLENLPYRPTRGSPLEIADMLDPDRFRCNLIYITMYDTSGLRTMSYLSSLVRWKETISYLFPQYRQPLETMECVFKKFLLIVLKDLDNPPTAAAYLWKILLFCSLLDDFDSLGIFPGLDVSVARNFRVALEENLKILHHRLSSKSTVDSPENREIDTYRCFLVDTTLRPGRAPQHYRGSGRSPDDWGSLFTHAGFWAGYHRTHGTKRARLPCPMYGADTPANGQCRCNWIKTSLESIVESLDFPVEKITRLMHCEDQASQIFRTYSLSFFPSTLIEDETALCIRIRSLGAMVGVEIGKCVRAYQDFNPDCTKRDLGASQEKIYQTSMKRRIILIFGALRDVLRRCDLDLKSGDYKAHGEDAYYSIPDAGTPQAGDHDSQTTKTCPASTKDSRWLAFTTKALKLIDEDIL